MKEIFYIIIFTLSSVCPDDGKECINVCYTTIPPSYGCQTHKQVYEWSSTEVFTMDSMRVKHIIENNDSIIINTLIVTNCGFDGRT